MLTEVLLKVFFLTGCLFLVFLGVHLWCLSCLNQQVTDELFDEIAAKVLDEDDLIDESKESLYKQLKVFHSSVEGLTCPGL